MAEPKYYAPPVPAEESRKDRHKREAAQALEEAAKPKYFDAQGRPIPAPAGQGPQQIPKGVSFGTPIPPPPVREVPQLPIRYGTRTYGLDDRGGLQMGGDVPLPQPYGQNAQLPPQMPQILQYLMGRR